MSRRPSIVITCRIPKDWEGPLMALCEARGIDPVPDRGKPGGLSLLLRQLVAEQIGEDEKKPPPRD